MKQYHQVVWNEPLIFEMGTKGKRGHLVPEVDDEIEHAVGDVVSRIPANMQRKQAPNLPELSESEVMTHYLHLSQETFGFDSGISIGMGTCTMKYSPKISDRLAAMPQMADIHPLQDEETVQGILEVMYNLSRWLSEIAGMDEFSLQPAGGGHAVFTNSCIIRAYHKLNGELEQRNEIVTPVLSHPCNAAAPATAGFKVASLYPDESGCVDIDAVKAAVSKHTAGMTMTNPYDIGIFDKNIKEIVKIVHEAGGLMACDMGNYNGLLGVIRAGDMGFDLCHFNAHKSFSTPHGSGGPGLAPIGVKQPLKKFLPVPVVEFDGERYHLDYDNPQSIGKVRGFYGTVSCALRAYAWIMALGAEGLREVAEVATVNNNYLVKKLLEISGITLPFAEGHPRLEQARFSWKNLKEDTGLGTEDVVVRLVDFGVMKYFTSHHPWIVEEPFTPEPAETVTKADIDKFVEILRQISREAYTDPEMIRNAPHNLTISRIDPTPMRDPKKWAMTWRAHLRKEAMS